MSPILQVFLPNRALPSATSLALVGFWAGTMLLLWALSPFQTLPTPGEVWRALGSLWWQHGMGPELITTIKLIAHATALTVALSLALAYATVLPFFRPLVAALSKLRFLGLTGLIFPFTLLFGGGHGLKVAMLTFGMASFFLTSMAQVVVEIPREQFDHMRVLGASERRIVWEVVILGTADKALEITRQNVAIGWAMITMVEGIARAEGGIGTLILNQNKHFRLAEVYAILLAILVIGLLMDYGMGVLGDALCPHARLDRVKR
jgi:NitT/TauT family transport system permease protein